MLFVIFIINNKILCIGNQKLRKFNKKQLPKISLSEKEKLAITQFLSQQENLNIEIGCGVGLHPIEYVKTHKPEQLIAIERTKTKFNKFLNRFNSQLKQNPDLKKYLLPIKGDGLSFVVEFIKKHSVCKYFLLHPNPYPKARQLNKRWYAMPAMSVLIESLKPKGRIYLSTNQEYYYKEALDYMQNVWQLSLEQKNTYYQADIKGQTHFEKKYLKRGDAIYSVVFKKSMLD